jgi:protein phosphatase
MQLGIQMAYCTHKGCVRSTNQDNALVRVLPMGALLGVCDGMGGEKGGEIASAVTVQTIEEAALAWPLGEPDHAARFLVEGLRLASLRVNVLAQKRDPIDLTGMGTTASIAAIVGDRMVYGQVGDSRIYLVRNRVLYQVTRDQSLAQLMVERGQLREEDVETFHMRNVILQAVGPHPSVDVDVRSVPIGCGDVILVCSDGLYGAIKAPRILETLLANPEPESACRALVDAALEEEASDNVTCVVARVSSGPDRSAEAVMIESV